MHLKLDEGLSEGDKLTDADTFGFSAKGMRLFVRHAKRKEPAYAALTYVGDCTNEYMNEHTLFLCFAYTLNNRLYTGPCLEVNLGS